MNLLDQYEGVPEHYLRISLPFRAIDGTISIVQAYIAHPDQLVEEQEPASEYMGYIQKGYEEHGFKLIDLNIETILVSLSVGNVANKIK